MRLERETERRSNAAVVIGSILSLLVVVAAVAVVAWLVLRTPETAVDSAERLDPVGTALPAPTEQPALPTAIPTEEPTAEPEPTALGFTGEQPAVAGLPTVAAPVDAEPEPQEEPAGPTPTPRVIAQPTEPPPTPVPAAPTLPPAVPVTEVPVVALQPVEAAPPPPTAAPVQSEPVTQPTPRPADDDDDPFNIFDEERASSIVPVAGDAQDRVREMQEEIAGNRPGAVPTLAPGEEQRRDEPAAPAAGEIPAIEPRTVTGNDGTIEVVVPDVDAMIDEITTRTTDPDRNTNARDDNNDDRDTSTDNKKRKSLRDRIKERTRSSTSRDDDDDNPRLILPNGNNNPALQGGDDDCRIGDPGFPFC